MAVASLVVERRLQGMWASVVVAPKLSSCGAQAQWPHGMWDHPGPRIEPRSPALASRFFTTEPPGKPPNALNANKMVPPMPWSSEQGVVTGGWSGPGDLCGVCKKNRQNLGEQSQLAEAFPVERRGCPTVLLPVVTVPPPSFSFRCCNWK